MAERKLKIDIRRGKILERLQAEGRVSVTQLSQSLGATTVTIRNDLAALERDGYLMRMQGGAVQIPRSVEGAVSAIGRKIRNEAEKRAIARKVAECIQDGDSLFINSGTTTSCIAAALEARTCLNVVTNSLEVATIMGKKPAHSVILLGGEINAQHGFTYGVNTQEQISRYKAGWAIICVDGISVKGGITTCYAEEAIINRMMLGNANRIMIVADHTKLGMAGFTRLCECMPQITLVTDAKGREQGEILAQSGMTVLYGEE